MTVPAVSVLIPVRDAGAFFGPALRSVKASVDVDFELVVVDNASVDGSAQLAREAGARVLEAGPVPIADALELGRSVCRAPFIARMDADDLMHKRRLSEDLAHLRARGDLALTASQARLFPRGRITPGMHMYVLWQNAARTPADHAREMWIEQPLCQPALTFRASALDEVGGYRSGPFPEDYELLLRMAERGMRMEKRPVVRHLWRDHGARETYTVDGRYHRDAFAKLKAASMMRRFDLSARALGIIGTGREAGRIARALAAHAVRALAYFDLPQGRVGGQRNGVAVLDVAALGAWRRDHPAAFVIGAVGTSGARGAVRGSLREAGFVEGEDAVVVA